ncbi:MAG TPA: radical SAM protein, partial [Desulfobacteria bacterium]|nr:radical SAM protein [Desulfobacteria bacterium]
MKILLTTLNSKFIHANLALRYLRGMGAEEDILLREYTINDRLEVIAGDIFQLAADVIGFSCYIWNITETLELIDTLHQVSPETIIILGGPEVSYDPGEYLTRPGVDFVVFGEGEQTWRELLTVLRPEVPKRVISRERLSQINGLAYRADGKPVINQPRELIKDLGTIPSPYLRLDGLENKIAYVESTRGCPFNCQYCLSSTFQGVRYFPLERTKQELKQLIAAGVTQVKFVDRTFNCNKQHALAIWRFLAAWHPAANFHFEISADLLDEEIISFLRQVPPGLFQFEIGVQSTNSQTLDSIRRKTNL